MVLPLIPIIAGLGGLSGGLGLAQLLGGGETKKEQAQTTTYLPYSHYQPSNPSIKVYAPQIDYPSYQTILDSPFASQSVKKSQESDTSPTMEATPSWSTAAPAIMDTPSATGEMTPLAIVAVIGVLGYAILSKKK